MGERFCEDMAFQAVEDLKADPDVHGMALTLRKVDAGVVIPKM